MTGAMMRMIMSDALFRANGSQDRIAAGKRAR
jgi:hypothetical protein